MKITIPEKLSEIKLKDYQKYFKILQDNPEADEFITMKYIEIFCKLKIHNVNAISVVDFEDIVLKINEAFQEKPKFKQFFTYKGVKFGFIPNLEDISMGEYVDLTSYLTDISTVNKAMAVMYRPIINESKGMYLIEPYESANKYADVMKEVSLDVYLGSQVFFYNLGRQLVKHTVSSLGQTQEGLEVEKTLLENGVGITQFMHLLEESFLDKMKLHQEGCTNVSHG